ncbi:hypothetical protein PMI15_01486 [Polaromonas sp. CF318]|uniref:hypothetical protein n=1 Tax=Polaromonas sp. CF318 TaxID=1144318 RepID=UPI0002710FF8|nr:hypothetical protein [Polaromonas sp. CF318]EJL86272.1 hypothetical protein PMI15_01486 [Polaromonas sp. CF318]
MPPASNKRRGSSSAGALVWLLAAALLLAQLLGLMHGVVHGPQAHPHSHAHAHHDGDHHEHSVLAPAEEQNEGGWLASLFASHDGDSDCRLFDQASHGQAAPAFPMLSLPLVLSSLAFDISRGEALARWAALFDARGPPFPR